MKSAVYTVCFLIPLAILFVVIERKDLYSDVEAVVLAEAVTKEKTATVVETESSPITATAASFVEMNSDMDTRTDEASVSSVSRTMPVVTPEESRVLSGEATSFQNSNKVKPVPVAIPVLTPEEAVKANKEAIRIQRNESIKKTIRSFSHKIGLNANRIDFLISLLPLLLISDILLLKKKKESKTCSKTKNYFSLSRRICVLFSVSLLAFGLLIFVPWSVYFGNSLQMEFIFQDFVNWNLRLLTVSIIGLCIVLLLIPPVVSDYFVATIAGLGLCVYVQAMFMNQNLGTMDGLEPEWNKHLCFGIINLVIWGIIILIPIILKIVLPSYFSKAVSMITAIILALELIATASMVVSAKQSVWKHSTGFYEDGSKQFQLSKKKNVVVFIFDNMGSGFMKKVFDDYPETRKMLKDFIWYYDARSNYDRTFAGLHHELTGTLIHIPAKHIDEIYETSWSSPSAKSFYKQVRDAGYDTRLYSTFKKMLIGDQKCYHEYFSNIQKREVTPVIDEKRLHFCLMQMSGFSFAPYLLKRYFFYSFDFAENIVSYHLDDSSSLNDTIPISNDTFYEKLTLSGITTNSEKPVLAFYYTFGTHRPWIVNEKCQKAPKAFKDPIPTTRSCFLIVSEFIRLLKKNQIYDNTAICIVSDHGAHEEMSNSTVIFDNNPFGMAFMVKPFKENKPEITLDDSKLQSLDLLPTLLSLACGEKADYTDFEGYAPFNVPKDRSRRVFVLTTDSHVPAFNNDPDFVKTFHKVNSYYEYSFSSPDKFQFGGPKSESFVRMIPLKMTAEEEKTIPSDN